MTFFFFSSFRAKEFFWINYLDIFLDFVVFYPSLEKKCEFTNSIDVVIVILLNLILCKIKCNYLL